jgi:hypothetical protein
LPSSLLRAVVAARSEALLARFAGGDTSKSISQNGCTYRTDVL